MFIVKKLSDNSKEYLNTYYDIIDQMSKAINGCEIGKSIGGLYINQITPLLQASIDLNNNILKYTTNTDIENFAKNMTFDRNNEIQKLSEITATCACVCNSIRTIYWRSEGSSKFSRFCVYKKFKDGYYRGLFLTEYDEAIAHVANQRIEIDLDDGVKVNYAKFQGVEVAQEGKKALKVDLLAKI